MPLVGEARNTAPSAEHLVMDARLSGDLQRALERIPERQRTALLLAELHDLTGLELAAALGVSHVAARALLTRARESLRQALAVEREALAAAEAADAMPTSTGAPAHEPPPASRTTPAPASSPRCAVDERLDPRDDAWLDAHLAGCDACSRVAADYDAQRSLFAPARAALPVPPRDLWARTAAAIDDASPARRRSGLSRLYAPLAGAMVVAVAVGLGLLNGMPAKESTSKGDVPDATPFPLIAGEVQTISRNEDGQLELGRQPVDEVCPLSAQTCGVDARPERTDTELLTAAADWDAIISPSQDQVVVVERGDGAQGVFVLPVGSTTAVESSPEPVETTPPATDEPSSEAPTEAASTEPRARPTSRSRAEAPVESPGETATADPGESTPAETPDPSEAPASPTEPAASDEPVPSVEPSPRHDRRRAAVERADHRADAVGRGDAPAGRRRGDREQRHRHRHDRRLLAERDALRVHGPARGQRRRPGRVRVEGRRRPGARDHRRPPLRLRGLARQAAARQPGPRRRGTDRGADARATAARRPCTTARCGARRSAPTARSGVWWDGSIRAAADDTGWLPDRGELVLGTWPADDSTKQVLGGSDLTDWAVRWDEDGTLHRRVDDDRRPDDAGTLSLYDVDPATGRADLDHPKLDKAPAFDGFSLRDGRLTWSAPADGGDTTVQVLAWKGDQIGRFELLTEDGTTVVR